MEQDEPGITKEYTSSSWPSRVCSHVGGFDFFFFKSERLFSARVAEADVASCVPSAPSEFNCSHLCSRLERNFSRLDKRSLRSAILLTFRPELLSIAFWTTFVYGIRFYQRLLLGEVMSFFESDNKSLEVALGLATAAILMDTLGQTILLPWFYNQCKLVALKMRVALIALVFKKMLRLSPLAEAKVGGTGHIVTLCTSELQRLDTYSGFMGSSIGFVILSILVVINIGHTPEGQAGLLMGLLMATTSISLAWPISIFAKLRDVATDARMKLISEFIPAARGVKMNVMEQQLQREVSAERGRETMQAKRMLIWKGFSQFLYVVCTNLLMLGMLVGAQRVDGSAGIPIARFYTAFSICVYIVEMSMYCVPRGVQGVVEITIALRRVEAFLRLDELDQKLLTYREGATNADSNSESNSESNVTTKSNAALVAAKKANAASAAPLSAAQTEAALAKSPVANAFVPAASAATATRASSLFDDAGATPRPATALTARDLSFSWPTNPAEKAAKTDGGSEASTLLFAGVNLEVQQGELLCITGDVGVGKSTLLMVLASQLQCESGTVAVSENHARVYVPQTPWVFSGSIRENICVTNGAGSEEENAEGLQVSDQAKKQQQEERYQQILQACCLRKDIEGMPDGDETVVGEQGVTLSGGQKQRLSIARGLYRGGEILLLDDPFSALDSSTHAALMETLDECAHRQNMAVVLVTHQLQHAGKCADRVLELMPGGQLLEREVVGEAGGGGQKEGTAEQEAASGASGGIVERGGAVAGKAAGGAAGGAVGAAGVAVEAVGAMEQDHPSSTQASPATATARLYEDEAMGAGGISLSMYRRYILAGGGGGSAGFAISFFLLIVCEAIVCWVTVIVAKALEDAAVTTSVLSLCWWLMALVVLLALVASSLFHIRLSSASQLLHAQMLSAVIASPISSFFDITPLGRILNRFSKDIGLLDQELPITMFDCA
jgi:ABC-type multidrug transport system fused ATPase/permease subunit